MCRFESKHEVFEAKPANRRHHEATGTPHGDVLYLREQLPPRGQWLMQPLPRRRAQRCRWHL